MMTYGSHYREALADTCPEALWGDGDSDDEEASNDEYEFEEVPEMTPEQWKAFWAEEEASSEAFFEWRMKQIDKQGEGK